MAVNPVKQHRPLPLGAQRKDPDASGDRIRGVELAAVRGEAVGVKILQAGGEGVRLQAGERDAKQGLIVGARALPSTDAAFRTLSVRNVCCCRMRIACDVGSDTKTRCAATHIPCGSRSFGAVE